MSKGSQRATVTSEVLNALEGAGYDVSRDISLSEGLVAYEIAQMLYHRRQGGGAKRQKVGRNQPCPCGSGKKSKRCCRDRKQFDGLPVIRSPLEEPSLIPRLDDLDMLTEDVERLGHLLRTDPLLREIRFNGSKATRFFLSVLNQSDTRELTEELFDDAGHRYFVEVENETYPDGTVETLCEAALRTNDLDELRSLALGLAFGAWAEGQSDVPDLFATLLFKQSVLNLLEATKAIDALAPEFRSREVLMKVLGDPSSNESQSATDKLAALKADTDRPTKRVLQDLIEDMLDLILDDRFPVRLSLASVLPFYVEESEGAAENDDEGSFAEIEAALDRAWDSLIDEDWRLFEELLEQYSRADAGDDSEISATVRIVADLLAHDALEIVARPLWIATLKSGDHGSLPNEEDFWSKVEGGVLEPTSLEQYADFLQSRGYPMLAERTRQLACRLAKVKAEFGQKEPAGPSCGAGAS
jgi:hypothetical protein